MKIKIVADSSSNVLNIEGISYSSVPLTIITNEKEYVDDENLDVNQMVKDLSEYKGKSSTSCPSVGSWLNSFEDADIIYVVTITSNLSGSYNSAIQAKTIYLEKKPNAKIHVFDTLSTGPEMELLIEKLAELINEGKEFDEVITLGNQYLANTKLFFSLESLHNLAQNGRVSKLSEIASRILSIRVVGQASIDGVLQVLSKCRGIKNTISRIVNYIVESNYKGGKLKIAHVNNLEFALKIKQAIKEKFKEAKIFISECRGLCSFYAEEGGVLIGCECF